MCCRSLRYVAIKIFISDRRHVHSDEVSILRRLADGPAYHVGKENVVELLDEFESEGPNGRHQCVVTEALGRVLNPATVFPHLRPEATCELSFPTHCSPFPSCFKKQRPSRPFRTCLLTLESSYKKISDSENHSGEVAKQLVEATAYMHSMGIAHGGAYFSRALLHSRRIYVV